MKEKMKYLNWLVKEILASLGTGVVTLGVMSCLMGDIGEKVSPIFSLGKAGISIDTLAQFLLLAVFSVVVKDVFMTDRWIKNMSVFLRKSLYFFVIVLGVFVMSRLFKWFPADAARAWIAFGIFFSVAMVFITILTRTKEITENNKLQEALEEFQKRKKEE
ncbi:MAG: DUF3021 family protein [Clostridia bacterium]|nr:DUF3021 family protein [Clostridia bacterium]